MKMVGPKSPPMASGTKALTLLNASPASTYGNVPSSAAFATSFSIASRCAAKSAPLATAQKTAVQAPEVAVDTTTSCDTMPTASTTLTLASGSIRFAAGAVTVGAHLSSLTTTSLPKIP